jgi:hypothetical protein
MDFADLLEETLEAGAGSGGLIEGAQHPRPLTRPPRTAALRELVQHILEVAMMMTGELTRPDTDFHRASWPRLLARYARPAGRARTKPALVRLLRTQLRDAEPRFRRAGELELLQLIMRFDGKRGTKLAWWHHGIAHEEYHRGQLALYARLLGREPALTRRIRGG